MGVKTVVKRQNIASLDRSKDILARHKRPGNGFTHQIMTDDITLIDFSEQNPSCCPNNVYNMVASPRNIQIATL